MRNNSSSSGMGILSVVGVVFITLKLVGVINWSWWWVTAPFWGGFVLVGTIFIIGIVLILLKAVLEGK